MSVALRATTVGVLALVSLHAFEALALTTVMPTIARDLDGASLYAMAFTATLASGIVSIVWSGNLADRRGPRPPLLLGLALFATGLVVAGLAPSMGVLVAARVVQGLGAGMTSTALYVLVTRVYPQRLHTAILAGFSAAWVVPSIAGPFVAGVITQTIGWRWVFGLALVVLVVAAVLLGRIIAGLRQDVVDVPWRTALHRGVGRARCRRARAQRRCRPTRPVGRHGRRRRARRRGADPPAAHATRDAPRCSRAADRHRPARPRLRRLQRGRGLPAATAHRTRRAEPQPRRRRSHRDRRDVVRRLLGAGTLGPPVRDRPHGVGVPRRDHPRPSSRSPGLWPSAAPTWVVIALFPVVGLGIGTLYPRVTAQALARAGATEQGLVSSALQIGDSSGAATAIALSAIVVRRRGRVRSRGRMPWSSRSWPCPPCWAGPSRTGCARRERVPGSGPRSLPPRVGRPYLRSHDPPLERHPDRDLTWRPALTPERRRLHPCTALESACPNR